MASDLKPGDEVMLPAFAFVAPLEAIVLCGAIPRFIDVDPETYNVDPDNIREAVNSSTKAIIVVHLFGQCADMDPILELASDHGIKVIEDAAQSFGARYRGKPAGSLGEICCFSFYPTKNLSCMGDGGMVGTRETGVLDKLKYLRNHGEVEKYRHAMVGMNSRLDEIQAAILLTKLPIVEKWNARRAEIAGLYNDAFEGFDLKVPSVGEENLHVYHQYTLQVSRRDELVMHLKGKRVATAIHYPYPLSQQPAYEKFAPLSGSLPVSERLTKQVVSLPIYPQMDDGQVNRVIEGVRSFFGRS
jgi:dTDP-4-amino-4,6-dideoxygalactose transaminase